MTRFFPWLKAVASRSTIGVSLLSANTAQAVSLGFYDLNIEWEDDTTTTGWIRVNGSPKVTKSHYFTTQYWDVKGLLNASITHAGRTYEESSVRTMEMIIYQPLTKSFLQREGKIHNHLRLVFSGNQALSFHDFGADGSPATMRDFGSKSNYNGYRTNSRVHARKVSFTKRAAAPVPALLPVEGTALAGTGVVVARRKQQSKASA